MDTKNSFRQKIDELENQINKVSKDVDIKSKKFPTAYIVGAATPLIVGATLYFAQPSFVQNKESGEQAKNNKKVFCWTLVISILIWIVIYLFVYFRENKSA
ncbi:hypothetical protein OAG24_00260 [bacterium]|nr:hypothetical protein [bacterium]